MLQFSQRGRSFGMTLGARSCFGRTVAYRYRTPVRQMIGALVSFIELQDTASTGSSDFFEINHLDPSFELSSE